MTSWLANHMLNQVSGEVWSQLNLRRCVKLKIKEGLEQLSQIDQRTVQSCFS